ncbi:hypothetical protein ACT3SZ_15190 [Corynebacterium sp. AOP40-9SA-29]|uniref:hypothetical protein n=1 Tax=Corynebacterium sp. AOP40-9SA-29 TaxID=3457677 RepID=UPI0040347CF8
MDNTNRFTLNRSRGAAAAKPPSTQDAFSADEPRPHKPGVRLTADQMKRFKRALVERDESIQTALERAVEQYIAEPTEN